VRLCINLCLPTWDARGDFMYISFSEQGDPNSYALPIRRGSGLPDLPSTVITGIDDVKKSKSMTLTNCERLTMWMCHLRHIWQS
jgi:hypothetical protein